MEKTVLNVIGMSCGHCVQAVKGAVGALEGVHDVDVDLAAKTVSVEHDTAACPLAKIRQTIEDQGFDIA